MNPGFHKSQSMQNTGVLGKNLYKGFFSTACFNTMMLGEEWYAIQHITSWRCCNNVGNIHVVLTATSRRHHSF